MHRGPKATARPGPGAPESAERSACDAFPAMGASLPPLRQSPHRGPELPPTARARSSLAAARPSKAGSKFDIGFDEYNPGALLVVDAPGDGDKLKIGKEYKILWHSDGYTGSSVRLELVRGGEVVRAIGDKTPNDGFAKWTVPNDVPARKGYSVRITNVNDPIFSDESEGGFKIVNP